MTEDQGPTMEGSIIQALFACMFAAQQGKIGMFGADLRNPEGMGQVTILTLDSILFDRHIVPALKAAGLDIVHIRKET